MTGKKQVKNRILTGDRTTGKLHLGHYVGSLKKRVEMQDKYETFILLADVQALTTHFDKPQQIQKSVRNITEDYLAAGIDPEKATIFVQSHIPEIAELTIYFSMFVTVNSLRHNPTVKSEAAEHGYKDLYYGFLGYPVSQAADISFCKATLVPAGGDQVPHIEQTRKIVRRFNELYKPIFIEPEAVVGKTPRLKGLDGKNKMSKSMANAIYLDSSRSEIFQKVQKAVTDPSRIRKDDPGHPQICPIFSYHKAFSEKTSNDISESCQSGKIGCVECKQLIANRIDFIMEPMRERRQVYRSKPKLIEEIVLSGTQKAQAIAKETMKEVRDAMGINYF